MQKYSLTIFPFSLSSSCSSFLSLSAFCSNLDFDEDDGGGGGGRDDPPRRLPHPPLPLPAAKSAFPLALLALWFELSLFCLAWFCPLLLRLLVNFLKRWTPANMTCLVRDVSWQPTDSTGLLLFTLFRSAAESLSEMSVQ